MNLNIKTSETGTKELVGVRMYTDTINQIDTVADKLNVKRSVIIRHAINEFLDSYTGE